MRVGSTYACNLCRHASFEQKTLPGRFVFCAGIRQFVLVNYFSHVVQHDADPNEISVNTSAKSSESQKKRIGGFSDKLDVTHEPGRSTQIVKKSEYVGAGLEVVTMGGIRL